MGALFSSPSSPGQPYNIERGTDNTESETKNPMSYDNKDKNKNGPDLVTVYGEQVYDNNNQTGNNNNINKPDYNPNDTTEIPAEPDNTNQSPESNEN